MERPPEIERPPARSPHRALLQPQPHRLPRKRYYRRIQSFAFIIIRDGSIVSLLAVVENVVDGKDVEARSKEFATLGDVTILVTLALALDNIIQRLPGLR